MDIKNLIKECHEMAVGNGFYECPECGGKGINKNESVLNETQYYCCYCNNTGINQNRNIGELLMLIVSELSEALEAHRNNEYADWKIYKEVIDEKLTDKKTAFENHIKDTFEDEIADTFIRLFDLCGYLELDTIHINKVSCCTNNNVADYLFHVTRTLWTIAIYYDNKTDSEHSIGNTIGNLLWFCEDKNIPIEKHIQAKLAYNKTRPYKHGKEY